MRGACSSAFLLVGVTCTAGLSAGSAQTYACVAANDPTTVALIRQVWAFTLSAGDYAVEDPAIVPGGEWMPVYIFDPRRESRISAAVLSQRR
jgi:hypothetical protein